MPEFQRRKIRFCLEQFAERLRVFKTQFIRDLADRQIGGRQFFFRFPDQFIVYMLLGALTGQHFQQIA
jgi:hypothetical protein